MLFRHALPRTWVAVLEREVLGVRAVAQNDGVSAVFHRSKDIGAPHQPVVHRDRYVPINPHTVANFPPLLQRRHHDLPTTQNMSCPAHSRPKDGVLPHAYRGASSIHSRWD